MYTRTELNKTHLTDTEMEVKFLFNLFERYKNHINSGKIEEAVQSVSVLINILNELPNMKLHYYQSKRKEALKFAHNLHQETDFAPEKLRELMWTTNTLTTGKQIILAQRDFADNLCANVAVNQQKKINKDIIKYHEITDPVQSLEAAKKLYFKINRYIMDYCSEPEGQNNVPLNIDEIKIEIETQYDHDSLFLTPELEQKEIFLWEANNTIWNVVRNKHKMEFLDRAYKSYVAASKALQEWNQNYRPGLFSCRKPIPEEKTILTARFNHAATNYMTRRGMYAEEFDPGLLNNEWLMIYPPITSSYLNVDFSVKESRTIHNDWAYLINVLDSIAIDEREWQPDELSLLESNKLVMLWELLNMLENIIKHDILEVVTNSKCKLSPSLKRNLKSASESIMYEIDYLREQIAWSALLRIKLLAERGHDQLLNYMHLKFECRDGIPPWFHVEYANNMDQPVISRAQPELEVQYIQDIFHEQIASGKFAQTTWNVMKEQLNTYFENNSDIKIKLETRLEGLSVVNSIFYEMPKPDPDLTGEPGPLQDTEHKAKQSSVRTRRSRFKY